MEENIVKIEAEIRLLESRLEKNNDTALRQRLSELQKAFRSEYFRIKNIVMTYEKDNNCRLYFVHSNKGFVKLFSNSALMFHDSVSPKLNMSPRILPDTDHKIHSADGVMSIKWSEKMCPRLEKLGCRYDEERSFPGLMAYVTPWTYRDKDIRRLKTHNSMFVSSFEKTIIPNNLHPTFFLRLSELNRLIYETTRNNHDEFFRDIYGRKFASLSGEIVYDYLVFSNQGVNENKIATIRAMMSKFNQLKYYAKIIADLNIWTPNVIGRLGDSLKDCETLLKDILFKMEQNEGLNNGTKRRK